MYCENCGTLLNENETVCPNCQNVVSNLSDSTNDTTNTANTTSNNSQYEDYKEAEKKLNELGFNKLLIFSILELFCCQLFGVIGLVLLFTKFKPAVVQKRYDEALSSRKTIQTLLIVGLILGVFVNIGYFVLQVLVAVVDTL